MADKLTAREIMTKNVITVRPEDDVEKVARLLVEHQVSGLPVVDGEGKVVGIITEGDLVVQEKKVKAPAYSIILGGVIYLESLNKFFEQLKRTIAEQVDGLMTSKVHTVGPDSTVQEIATIMAEKGVNRLPVVDEAGKLLGIVTRQDVIKWTHKS